MDSLSLCRLLLLEWKEIEAIGQLGQYHSGSTLENGIIELEKEGGGIPRTDGRPTSLHSTHDRQRVRNCFMGVPLSLPDCATVWIARLPPFLPYCVQNPRSFWRLARLRKVTVLRSPLLFDSSRVMCGGHGDGINRSREGGLDKGAQIPGRTHMTQQGGRVSREGDRGLQWTSGLVTVKSKKH